MTKQFCDRCKEEVKKFSATLYTDADNGEVFPLMDLCDKCEKSFRNWSEHLQSSDTPLN